MDNNPSTNTQDPMEKYVVKCSKRGCTAFRGDILFECPGKDCRRYLHHSCFLKTHGNKLWAQEIASGVVCTKKCFDSIQASISKKKPTWNTDGANGAEDPQSSERILLDWLLTPGNYTNKWKGKDNKGVSKKQTAATIARMMNEAGVKVERDGKQVLNKIQHLERQFRDAYDFCNTETGQGLEENDPEGFEGAVRKICLYYFDLLEIFGDHACAQPKITSNDDLDSSGSEIVLKKHDMDDDEEDDDDDDDISGGDDALGDGQRLRITYSDSDESSVKSFQPKGSKNILAKRFATEEQTVAMKKSKISPSSGSGLLASKGKPVATIFDWNTSQNIGSLVETKKLLVMAQVRKLEREEKNSSLVDEQQRIDSTIFKLKHLGEIRAQFPQLDDDNIIELFPDLEEVLKKMKKK